MSADAGSARPGLWCASLISSSPRYEAWRGIFGTDTGIPLASASSVRANLGPEKNVEVYLLDVKNLDAGQRARLVIWIHRNFGSPIDQIEPELDRVGFPIRAADVCIVFDLRDFL